MNIPRIFIVDGIDRLGKGTLIDGILNKLGYYQVIHFEKPKLLSFYDAPDKNESFRKYQHDGFLNMFDMISSNARIIFDRGHCGEFVYAPMYRQYQGDYVFNMEQQFGIAHRNNIRLILLTEDFKNANHFVDDGLSIDPSKREVEQNMFIDAFDKSIIRDKRMICVTDTATGEFRNKESILLEALANDQG